MAVADKIVALLDTMSVASLNSLSPVRRRQFADLCRHWAMIADQQKAPQGRIRADGSVAGVLASPPTDGAIARAAAKPAVGEA